MNRVMTLAVVAVLLGGCVTDEEADRAEVAVEASELAQNGDKVTVCHFPPGNPANAQTINVSENAVGAHLDHGDALGNCECVSDCSELGEQVEAICLELLQGFPVGDLTAEEFCSGAGDVVASSCGGNFCEQEPGPDGCFDACATVANETFEACLGLTPDPSICELGANVTFGQCLELFECPPPPQPCDFQCLDDANALLGACLEDPPAELICEGIEGDPVLQTCFAEGQGYLNDCLFADDGCFGPPVECGAACQAKFGEEMLACVSEPVCQDPAGCQAVAETNAQECFGSCCLQDCVEFECKPSCGGDPDCEAQCQAEVCEPQCFPAPTCDQQCVDQANAFIEECLTEPSEPICAEDPAALCLAKGYEVFADCLEGECDIDGCEPRCVGGCVAECNSQEACFDPAVNPCLEGCAPQGCPPDFPVECPDGFCAASPEECDEEPA